MTSRTSDEIPAHRARKDRKHWCRGKVGVPHQPECCPYLTVKPTNFPTAGIFANWRVLVCKVCGKHLACYYPMNGLNETPPDWVDK